MFKRDDLKEILFLDIETVPAYKTLEELPADLREIWRSSVGLKRPTNSPAPKSQEICAAKKEGVSAEEQQNPGFNYDLAGLYPEYSKIVCVSFARFEGGTEDGNLKIHSIAYHDEKELLSEVSQVLKKYARFRLCAHNGKNFDFPFIAKRLLINRMPLPLQLDIQGKKPWEVPHLDTQEMWSFGSKSSSSYVKLTLLCAVFGIPTPKDDIEGYQVSGIYYDEKDLPRIVRYCEKDVSATALVFKRMCIEPEQRA